MNSIILSSLLAFAGAMPWWRCRDSSLACELIRSGCFESENCDRYRRLAQQGRALANKELRLELMVKFMIDPEGRRKILERDGLDFWSMRGLLLYSSVFSDSIRVRFVDFLLENPGRLVNTDYHLISYGQGVGWELFRLHDSLRYAAISDSIIRRKNFAHRWCFVDSNITLDRCRLVRELRDGLRIWYPGLSFEFRYDSDDVEKSENYASVFKQPNGIPNFMPWDDEVGSKFTVVKKLKFPDSLGLELKSRACLIDQKKSSCKELRSILSSRFEGWLPFGFPNEFLRFAYSGSVGELDSLVASYLDDRAQVISRKDIKQVAFVVDEFHKGLNSAMLNILVRQRVIVAEDRHWFPQVEMPPAFALWFYGDSVRSQRRAVELRVPKLLALTATEQMACLRDTTKAHCGEIRDFVRETSTWGGAESVKPFKFLIRPLTRKPPGWR